jgi:hypothetical protein
MQPTFPPDAAGDAVTIEEYALPRAESLLAATLALMTGYVQGCCDEHRGPMAQKVVQHLLSLSQHPLLTPDFQTLLWNLHTRWLEQSRQSAPRAPLQATPVDAAFWHKAPEVVQ